jgi:glutathione S-transferase
VSERRRDGRDAVLLRCPTPTDWLCPCGTVARRLRKLGIEHRVERVPYRRSSRPEVVELTDQRRVPVLIDGTEVISDSKRILEYLDWRYGNEGPDRGRRGRRRRRREQDEKGEPGPEAGTTA